MDPTTPSCIRFRYPAPAYHIGLAHTSTQARSHQLHTASLGWREHRQWETNHIFLPVPMFERKTLFYVFSTQHVCITTEPPKVTNEQQREHHLTLTVQETSSILSFKQTQILWCTPWGMQGKFRDWAHPGTSSTSELLKRLLCQSGLTFTCTATIA